MTTNIINLAFFPKTFFDVQNTDKINTSRENFTHTPWQNIRLQPLATPQMATANNSRLYVSPQIYINRFFCALNYMGITATKDHL